jgi:hypothetical protein
MARVPANKDAEITVKLNDGLAVAWRVGDFLGLLDHALQGIDGGFENGQVGFQPRYSFR